MNTAYRSGRLSSLRDGSGTLCMFFARGGALICKGVKFSLVGVSYGELEALIRGFAVKDVGVPREVDSANDVMGTSEEIAPVNGVVKFAANGIPMREANGEAGKDHPAKEAKAEVHNRENFKEPKTNGRAVAPPTPLVIPTSSDQENASENSLKRRRSSLPLEVGTRVLCKWRDDKLHPVKVIERRKLSTGPDDYQYYVHYTEFNRRLDEWVKLEQLDVDSVETDADEKVEEKVGNLKMTRHQKRKIDETHVEEGHEDFDAASLREHEEFTKVKNISKIELGKYEIDTWYFSPFPPEYSDCSKLFFCEFCLSFMKRKEQLGRHMRKCDLKHPPGDEIYRNGSLSMFEVDGKKNKIFGQNLCYLAKLFLDHKTLYYDVDLFLFYILCECDDRGCHMVGYFSKEKHSEEGYNLACILTLPPYQRKGYGKFLIAFSYELSKKEGKVGTPERPLSDLGLLSYRGYWTRILLEILKKHRGNVSIKELSDMTAIKTEDVISTLQSLELIQYRKGQHVICADPKLLERHLKAAGRGGLDVDASKLIWTPYKEQGG